MIHRLGMPATSHAEADRIVGKMLACFGMARLENVDPRAYAREKVDGLDGEAVSDALDAVVRRKSAIGALENDSSWAPAQTSFAQGIFNDSVLGRVTGARRLPFVQQAGIGAIVGAGAAFRAGGAAIRVAPVTFSGTSMSRHSVGSIGVFSNDFLRLAVNDGTAADTVASVLRDAIRRELDSVFTGSAAASAAQPAGLAGLAQPVASTGSTAAAIATDVNSMFSTAIGGGVSSRRWQFATSSEAYSYLATSGVLDPAGTLAGCPVVSGAPSGAFLLIAGDFLTYAMDDAAEVMLSSSASVEMDSAPVGDIVAPTSATATRVGLFQTDCSALRASLAVDWAVGGPTDSSGSYAVISLTGAAWA